MKLNKFFNVAIFSLLSTAFFLVSCNEGATDPGTTTAPGAPTNLMAVSMDANKVGLKWTAPSDTTGVTYTVSWKNATNDSGSASTASTMMPVTVAKSGEYVFSVVSVKAGVMSAAATLSWAGAKRYASADMKMYEKASSKGSAIYFDPQTGPKNVNVSTTGNPNLATVQLATFIDGENVRIGSANAFSAADFQNINSFDSNTVISGSTTIAANSLDEHYANINPATLTYSKKVLSLVNAANTGTIFYLRTGSSSANYHYARVFVKPVAGKLIQGTSPDRYVQIEASYQETAGLGFAKR